MNVKFTKVTNPEGVDKTFTGSDGLGPDVTHIECGMYIGEYLDKGKIAGVDECNWFIVTPQQLKKYDPVDGQEHGEEGTYKKNS